MSEELPDLNYDITVSWDAEREQVVFSRLSTGEEIKRWDYQTQKEVPVESNEMDT